MEALLEEKLRAGISSVGVGIDDLVISLLGRYLDLLLLWNRRVNLSAIRDPASIIEKHFVDSLAVLPFVPSDAQTLVDVGSGAGFPGAVLALARPGLDVTLVESIHKKTAFLEALRRDIPIPNLHVRTERIEDSPVRADIAISRATWDLPVWLEKGSRVVRPGGTVLGMEGADLHDLPPAAVRHPYSLGQAARAIVVFHVER